MRSFARAVLVALLCTSPLILAQSLGGGGGGGGGLSKTAADLLYCKPDGGLCPVSSGAAGPWTGYDGGAALVGRADVTDVADCAGYPGDYLTWARLASASDTIINSPACVIPLASVQEGYGGGAGTGIGTWTFAANGTSAAPSNLGNGDRALSNSHFWRTGGVWGVALQELIDIVNGYPDLNFTAGAIGGLLSKLRLAYTGKVLIGSSVSSGTDYATYPQDAVFLSPAAITHGVYLTNAGSPDNQAFNPPTCNATNGPAIWSVLNTPGGTYTTVEACQQVNNSWEWTSNGNRVVTSTPPCSRTEDVGLYRYNKSGTSNSICLCELVGGTYTLSALGSGDCT